LLCGFVDFAVVDLMVAISLSSNDNVPLVAQNAAARVPANAKRSI
jgi:hypothetical protein